MPAQLITPHSQPAKCDRTRQSDAMAKLFAAMIVCDGRVHQTELEALKAILVQGDEYVPTESWWTALTTHLPEVMRYMRGPNRRRWLSLQLIQLRGHPGAHALEDALWRLATSDGELHPSETLLLDLVLQSRQTARGRERFEEEKASYL